MTKKYSIEGSYQINGNEEKEFEIQFDNHPEKEEKKNKLLTLLNHPWRLIKEGGKLGVNGVKRFFSVLFIFSVSNTFLFFYSFSRLFATDFEFSKLLVVIAVFVIGLGVTIFAVYRTYQYVVIDTIRVIYENLSSFFHKVSDVVIDKVESASNGKVDLSDNQFTRALDFGKLVNTKYKKTPKFLRKGIILILEKIPFVGMLVDLKEDITKGNKVEASAKLYSKMDGFITESIFGNNNTKWVWWLLAANIIILYTFIKYKIG